MAIPRNLANIAPHVNASSTELIINDGSANLDFRVEGDGNANLIFADASVDKVGFGTNTFNTNGGVIQVSNGISFPATQSALSDANTLDDYEEGTWTPVIDSNTPGSGRVTENFSSNASYVKIGKTVFINCYVRLNTLGTGGSGLLVISGLPFTPGGSASAFLYSLPILYYTAWGGNLVYLIGNAQDGLTKIYFRGMTAAASGTTDLDFATYAATNMRIALSGSYMTST